MIREHFVECQGRPLSDFHLRYATLCSGVEAVSVAWEPLGMRPVFFSEIEPFPSAVLAERWPHVPNLGDLTKINGADYRGKVDILWASFPCQDFSIAGERAGIAGKRGSLTLRGVDLIDAIDPYFFCFENVKGILSDRNNAFGKFLGRLVGAGCVLEPPRGKWLDSGHVSGPMRAAAWRIMDAQYGGVAQQRSRLFLVSCPRNGASPQAILFEPEGMRWHSPPCKDNIATNTKAAHRRVGTQSRQIPAFSETARCLTTKMRFDAYSEDFIVKVDGRMNLASYVSNEIVNDALLRTIPTEAVRGVRRLTPLEYERLQGMPDNYTRINWKGASEMVCPDGPRYKAIGNSLAVPDVRWIGERIIGEVQKALDRRKRAA